MVAISSRADTLITEEKDQAFLAAVCFEDGSCKMLKTVAPMSEHECSVVQYVYRKRIIQEIQTHGEVEFGFSMCMHQAWLDPKTRKA